MPKTPWIFRDEIEGPCIMAQECICKICDIGATFFTLHKEKHRDAGLKQGITEELLDLEKELITKHCADLMHEEKAEVGQHKQQKGAE